MHAITLIPLLVAPLTTTQDGPSTPDALTWGPREVEHLMNRAGFGATQEDVYLWSLEAPEALVDHLLAPREVQDPFSYEVIPYDVPRQEGMTEDERREKRQELRRLTRRQANDFLSWWTERMISDVDPLGERMTLFWHGHFTSAMQTVKRGDMMIRQNELFREHATGNFGVLLREVLRDPAMLRYLDNNSNRKGRPNENLAREVMELFTLGEGHYGEKDIAEAARALTGHTIRGSDYRFVPRQHDRGQKTILGVTGDHDLDDLVDILLEQDACPRWIAERLLTYFEGAAPSLERRDRYARILEEHGYDLAPVLRALFLDPDFYRAEIVGAKVLSPIDFLVGTNRRLAAQPAPLIIGQGAASLGQRLFDPPNVKGWEGGFAWISTSTLMQRGNLAGMLLGVIDVRDLRNDEELDAMMDTMDDTSMEMEGAAPPRRDQGDVGVIARAMSRFEYRPRLNLRARMQRADAGTDAEVVAVMLDDLLAIEVPDETAAPLVTWFAAEREALGVEEEALLRGRTRGVEDLLRRLAHKILSLPEAQLG